MTDTIADPVATAIDLVRASRGLARDAVRWHPDSTWIDAYTAIDRTEAQLGNIAASPASAKAPSPAAAPIGTGWTASNSSKPHPTSSTASGQVPVRPGSCWPGHTRQRPSSR